MSKKVLILFFIISIFLMPSSVFAANSEESSLDMGLPQMNTKAFYVIDYRTGEVLAEENADTPRPPASMTKMMSAVIIFDRLKHGQLHWNDIVTVSSRAAAINEAEIRLEPGETQTVRQLVIAMFVQSANDATVALAEHIAGSEEAFVKLMNQKAAEIGLKETHFQNSTGLDDKDYPDPPIPNGNGQHVMSAHDTALLAQYLLKNYPEVLQFSHIPHYVFHPGTTRQQNIDNWDLMLPTLRYAYPGVDGLKTGHTNAAGYCFTGTINKDGFRTISVVMGTSSEYARFHETKKLLDYVYDHYQLQTAMTSGHAIKGYPSISIANGVQEKVDIAPNYSLELPERIGEQGQYSYHVALRKNVKAPLAKGSVVGNVELYYQGKPILGIKPVPLVTQKQVEKGSFLRLFFRKVWNDVNAWL